MLAPRPNFLLLRRTVNTGRRARHDFVSLPGGKPVVSYGPPGYSAVSGHTATVFGCTGFLGRYLVAKLGKMGTQVIVPYREEDDARLLKPMGDLGQIVRMEWDIRDETSIAECVRHSDIVYNLVGRDYETKNFDFKSLNVDGAERIAKISAQSGVSRFVQVSHLNASISSPSKFYATKAEGEERVKVAFPSATIIRPAAMFGYEDKLLNNMAIWPIWWKLNFGETKMRPVHVLDVAQALANLMSIPQLPQTINLPGPSTLTYEYLLELVSSVTLQPPSRSPVLPKLVAHILAKIGQSVWWPTLSPDEVIRRYLDDVSVSGDWETVGISQPSEIEATAITYLRRYRSAYVFVSKGPFERIKALHRANFVRPVVFPPRHATVTSE